MPPVGFDQQGITTAQITRLLLIGKLDPGAALQQHHPFEFRLVIPETFGAGCAAGVNALQAPTRLLQHHRGGFVARAGAWPRQQVAAAAFDRGTLFPPAFADFKSMPARQGHHVVMGAAGAQGLTHRGFGF